MQYRGIIYEELECGCILSRESIIELCMEHEDTWREKKFDENNDSELDEWYTKLDGEN